MNKLAVLVHRIYMIILHISTMRVNEANVTNESMGGGGYNMPSVSNLITPRYKSKAGGPNKHNKHKKYFELKHSWRRFTKVLYMN